MSGRMSMGRGVAVAATTVALLVTTACSGSSRGGGDGGDFTPPDQVEVVVHTAPGGGADLLAREIVAMLEAEKIIEPGSWTVENRDGGGSAVALSYLQEQAGRDDVIAFSSNVYIVNKLVTEGVDVGYGSFTPIVAMYDDTMAVAVAAGGPHANLQQFIDAARAAPGTLVQAGGSQTASDALAGQFLQREAGVQWEFLSFPGGGERKTALLRGDADLYMTEPIDMQENVEAGEMVPIAIIGENRVDTFPDTPSTRELGFQDIPPAQTRGVVGPPEMSQEAIAYYTDLIQRLTETDTWADFIERSAARPNFLTGDRYDAHLSDQVKVHTELFRETGQLVNE
jgi:putative tricarboxylic transport membrane protein